MIHRSFHQLIFNNTINFQPPEIANKWRSLLFLDKQENKSSNLK